MAKPIFGKSIDFNANIGAPGEPVAANGALLTAAGREEGASRELSGKVGALDIADRTKLTEQGAELAVTAVKVGAESSLSSEIKKTVDAYGAAVKVSDAQTTLDLFRSGLTSATPAEVEAAQADISKYKDALDQGVMTREQALLAIDKKVKEYSRSMPIFASDFRKQAYNLTGVEHLGAYSEYSLLAKAGDREKLAYDQKKFLQDTMQKQITMFVERYGRFPTGGLQGNDMGLFRQQLALEQQAAVLKTQVDVSNRTVEQNEPLVMNYVNNQLAQGILDVNAKLQGIPNATDPKTGKPMAPESKILVRQQILSDINGFFEKQKAQLLSFNTNQISNASRQQMVDRMNTQQKELVESLKNQDNFDDFRKTMELNVNKANDVMNKWAIANPHLQIIQKSGMATPEVAKLWLDMQREPKRAAEFVRIYGNAMDDYFRSVTSGGKGAADYHVQNMTESAISPQQMEALRITNPGAHQVAVQTLRDHIKAIALAGWGENQETADKQKTRMAQNLQVFSSQINLQDQSSVDEWTKLMSDPRVAAKIKELPADQQGLANAPVISKTREILENPEFGVMSRMNRLAEKIALTHGNPGAIQLVQNPVSQQIEVKYEPFEGVRMREGKTDKPQQTGRARPAPIVGDGSQVPDEGKELASLVRTANRSIAVMNNFKESLSPDLQPGEEGGKKTNNLAKDLVTKFGQGYFGQPVEGRVQSLEDRKNPKSIDQKARLKNADEVNAELNSGLHMKEGSQESLDAAARIRVSEAKGNPAEIEKVIGYYEQELKRSSISSEMRSMMKHELQMWARARVLAAPAPQASETGLDSK